MQDLCDAIGGHPDISREFGGAHIECFEFFGEVFARMDRRDRHRNSPKA